MRFFAATALAQHAAVCADASEAHAVAMNALRRAVEIQDEYVVSAALAHALAALIPRLRDAGAQQSALVDAVSNLEAAQPKLLLVMLDALPDQIDACTPLGFNGRVAFKAMLRAQAAPVLLRLTAGAADVAADALRCTAAWIAADILPVTTVAGDEAAMQCVIAALDAALRSSDLFEAGAAVVVALIVRRDMVTTALRYAHDTASTQQFVERIAVAIVNARPLFDAARQAELESPCTAMVDVLLAIAERQTAYLLSNSPTVAALVDLLLHCTLTGSPATVETIVNGWLTIAEYAVDAQQRQQLRPLIEHSLSACLQRCLRVKSSGAEENGDADDGDDDNNNNDDDNDGEGDDEDDEQLRSLRARVAELLCVSQMFIGVENMLNVLVELSASSSAGREAAWALLPGVAPALSAAQPRNIVVLLSGVVQAIESPRDVDMQLAALSAVRGCAPLLRGNAQFSELPQPILAAVLSLLADANTPHQLHEAAVWAVAGLCVHCSAQLRRSCADIVAAVVAISDRQGERPYLSASARASLARSCARLALASSDNVNTTVELLLPLLMAIELRLRALLRLNNGAASAASEIGVLVGATDMSVEAKAQRPAHAPVAALALMANALSLLHVPDYYAWLQQDAVCEAFATAVRNASLSASGSPELDQGAASLVRMIAGLFATHQRGAWLDAIASVVSNGDADEFDEDASLRCALLTILGSGGGGGVDMSVMCAYVNLARAIVSSAAAAEFIAQRVGNAPLESALQVALALLDSDHHSTHDREACELITFALGPVDLWWCVRASRTLLVGVLARGNGATRSMCDLLYLCLTSCLPINAQEQVAAVFGDAANPVLQRLNPELREKCSALVWAYVSSRQRKLFAALLKDIAGLCAGVLMPDVLVAFEIVQQQ